MPLRSGGLILHCRDVRKRQSVACAQPMEACPCIAAEVDISAQSRTGLPLQISETYMRLAPVRVCLCKYIRDLCAPNPRRACRYWGITTF